MKKTKPARIRNIRKAFLVGFILLFLLLAVFAYLPNFLISNTYADLSWSPDSHDIAFLRNHGQLYLYDTVTKEYIDTGFKAKPIFLLGPWYDNNNLWFDSSEGFYELDIRSMKYEQIVLPDKYQELHARPTGFIFSPDDKSMIFSDRELTGYDGKGRNVYTNDDLWQINLSTLEILRLTSTPDVSESNPQYSPNGEIMVAGDYYLQDGSWHKIANFFAESRQYSMSPDGQWILVKQQNPIGIYLLPVDSHTSRKLIREVPVAELAWSPNGCYVAYTTVGSPSRNELYIVKAEELGLETFIPEKNLCH